MRKRSKRVAVIKNAHTKAQMQAMENRFVEHKGPYLTLQQVLERAKTRQGQPTSHEKEA